MKPCSLLTIAGSDSGGGAGVQADLKTFAAHGVHGVCAITALTSQNTLGVQKVHPLPEQVVLDQLESIFSDFNVCYAKTGMLYSEEIIQVVTSCLREQKVPFVVDPVMSAEAGGSLLSRDALPAMRDLIRQAAVVTPNRFEAEILTEIKICSIEDAKDVALKLAEEGAKAVIITGGHLDGRDLVLEGGHIEIIEGTLLTGGTHGAGCTYSAALAVYLSQGCGIFKAAKLAKHFVTHAIASSQQVGGGTSPVSQLHHIWQDSQCYQVFENLTAALRLLEDCRDCVALVPEVGCNLAMAIPGATSTQDVAAVEGRILRLRGRMHPVGCVSFGASSHVARIILTAMKFNPGLRAAMNLRCAPEILDACEQLGLNIATFNREEEPPDSRSMEWGTSHAFKHSDTPPDVIYDAGGTGKEAMIRLLGEDALSIARQAIRIAETLAR